MRYRATQTGTNDMKNFYSGDHPPLLSADGSTLITDKEEILDRWAEHFNSVLNRPSTINDEAIDRLPQVPIDVTLNDVPALEEIQKAVQTWLRLHPCRGLQRRRHSPD